MDPKRGISIFFGFRHHYNHSRRYTHLANTSRRRKEISRLALTRAQVFSSRGQCPGSGGTFNARGTGTDPTLSFRVAEKPRGRREVRGLDIMRVVTKGALGCYSTPLYPLGSASRLGNAKKTINGNSLSNDVCTPICLSGKVIVRFHHRRNAAIRSLIGAFFDSVCPWSSASERYNCSRKQCCVDTGQRVSIQRFPKRYCSI